MPALCVRVEGRVCIEVYRGLGLVGLVGGQLFGISHLAYFVPCLAQIRVPLTEPHYVSQNPCVSRWCPTMCPTTRGFSNMIHGLDKRQATASFSTEWHPTLNLHFSVVEFHWVSLLHC